MDYNKSPQKLPGLDFIGCGYNPFINYGSEQGRTFQLFDFNKINTIPIETSLGIKMVPEILDVKMIGESKHQKISEESVEKYIKSFSTKNKIEGRYNMVSGSVACNFANHAINEAQISLTEISETIEQYSLALSHRNLRQFMSEDKRQEIDKLNVNNHIELENFFNKFGSHFITGVVMGGKFLTNGSIINNSSSSKDTLEIAVEVAYKELTSSVKVETKNESNNTTEKSKTSINISTNKLGGDSTITDFQLWKDSLKSQPSIVRFTKINPIEGIWTLCETQEKANAMKAYYDNIWAPQQEVKYAIHPDYISDLIIISSKNSNIKAPKGYTKLDKDLNQGAKGNFIYLCYTKNSANYETKEDAITDIKIIFNDDEVPSGYKKNDYDLNEGAGGDFIYLCYKKEKYNKKTAIKDLDVIAGNDHKISAPYGFNKINADLNKGAKGDFIYLCTLI